MSSLVRNPSLARAQLDIVQGPCCVRNTGHCHVFQTDVVNPNSQRIRHMCEGNASCPVKQGKQIVSMHSECFDRLCNKTIKVLSKSGAFNNAEASPEELRKSMFDMPNKWLMAKQFWPVCPGKGCGSTLKPMRDLTLNRGVDSIVTTQYNPGPLNFNPMPLKCEYIDTDTGSSSSSSSGSNEVSKERSAKATKAAKGSKALDAARAVVNAAARGKVTRFIDEQKAIKLAKEEEKMRQKDHDEKVALAWALLRVELDDASSFFEK